MKVAPRPLTDPEHASLDLMLSVEVGGVEVLREQA